MDLNFFHQHGYQILRDVIDPEVATAVRDFLIESYDQALSRLKEELGARDLAELVANIDEESKRPDFATIPHDFRLLMSGHYPLETRLSRQLWQLPRQPRLRRVLEAVFSDQRLFMHMPPMARFILPGNRHAGVPAHQDVSYNKHMSEFVTVWVPLCQIDDACGGVAVYEGSATDRELLSNQQQKFWFEGVPTEGFEKRHCKIDIGDALLLNRWIVHESMPNVSDRIRYSTDMRFFGSGDTSSKHVLDMQDWRVIEPR